MAKVGIANLNRDGNWEDTRELAVLADDLGYDCITVGEAWGGDAFTTLAHISALTKNIRIGTFPEVKRVHWLLIFKLRVHPISNLIENLFPELEQKDFAFILWVLRIRDHIDV